MAFLLVLSLSSDKIPVVLRWLSRLAAPRRCSASLDCCLLVKLLRVLLVCGLPGLG
jgi:hypothetical protein